jgi:hypothetical protein
MNLKDSPSMFLLNAISALSVGKDGHSTPPHTNPKSPQPKGFTNLKDCTQILQKIRMIPLRISGGYPPDITGSNDAFWENGLPAPYGHLIFQTAQLFIVWNMLSKSIEGVFTSTIKPWVGHKIGELG